MHSRPYTGESGRDTAAVMEGVKGLSHRRSGGGTSAGAEDAASQAGDRQQVLCSSTRAPCLEERAGGRPHRACGARCRLAVYSAGGGKPQEGSEQGWCALDYVSRR